MEGAINGGEGAPTALYNLREKYAAFVQDIADAEEADADIFYEDCDYEEKEELKEIIGNVECSNNDLDDFQNWLSGYHDGYNILTDYYIESPSRKFFYRIDPDGSAMFYTLLGLKWYHMWARDAGPVSLQDLLGQNHMMLECVLDKLGKLFPKAKQAYFKATKAIDKYTNFIHDLPETALKSEATSLNRQNKYDEILDHLREAAFIIKEQEDTFCDQDWNEIYPEEKLNQDTHTTMDVATATTGTMEQPSQIANERHAEIMQELKTIKNIVQSDGIDYQAIIALIREVRMAKIKGVTSLEKAVDYIRHCQPEDERFYVRAMAACQFVETVSKHEVGGVDKRWATLAQYAKGSDGACRRKAKSKGKPHPNIIPQGW